MFNPEFSPKKPPDQKTPKEGDGLPRKRDENRIPPEIDIPQPWQRKPEISDQPRERPGLRLPMHELETGSDSK